jgi:hypothetical protein
MGSPELRSSDGRPSITVRLLREPVWLKYCVASSGLSMVVAEQSTEAFSPHHVTRLATHCSLRRDESVVEPLMIALGMIVGEVLVDHMEVYCAPGPDAICRHVYRQLLRNELARFYHHRSRKCMPPQKLRREI